MKTNAVVAERLAELISGREEAERARLAEAFDAGFGAGVRSKIRAYVQTQFLEQFKGSKVDAKQVLADSRTDAQRFMERICDAPKP